MNDFVDSFDIQGEIQVPDGVDFDTFCNKFLEAMKILGWRFAGFFEDAPGLDIVEVVRCKDCKHRGDFGECPMAHIGFGDPPYGDENEDYAHDTGFCDYGERKEDHAEET